MGTTLTNTYERVFDALWTICKTCLFIAEGTGQSYHWSSWGDGFVTKFPATWTGNYGYHDVTFHGNVYTSKGRPNVYMSESATFFTMIHHKPWRVQVGAE
jgi:hypothetical protein